MVHNGLHKGLGMIETNGKSMLDAVIITFGEPRSGYDHITAYGNGKFIGFKPLDSDQVCLERCAICRKENYALAVLSGQCAWCGWDANDK